MTTYPIPQRGWLAPWLPWHEPSNRQLPPRFVLEWRPYHVAAARAIDDARRDELGWLAAHADDRTVGWITNAMSLAHPSMIRREGTHPDYRYIDERCPCHRRSEQQVLDLGAVA